MPLCCRIDYQILCLCIYITGIEPHGNKVMQPAVFTVETLEAGSGEVLVYVEDPEGHKEEASYRKSLQVNSHNLAKLQSFAK